MTLDIGGWDRAERENTSGGVPCEVTAVYLSAAQPRVKIRPLARTPYDADDESVIVPSPLEIDEIPYGFPCSPAFAFFVPPVVGMQGVLIVTQGEIGEVAGGEILTSRRQDARSGYFIPAGRLNGPTFVGNPDWAEMRSTSCRVAISRDVVHLQAGNTDVVLSNDGFDVRIGGVSLLAALKEMSSHLTALESLIHPNGHGHGGAHSRMIDTINAASPPVRNEQGV